MNKHAKDTHSASLIIIGAGGHARVLISALRKSHQTIIGVVDPLLHANSVFAGIPSLGGDDVVMRYSPDDVLLVNGIGFLPGQTKRFAVGEQFRQKGYRFASVIDRASALADDITL